MQNASEVEDIQLFLRAICAITQTELNTVPYLYTSVKSNLTCDATTICSTKQIRFEHKANFFPLKDDIVSYHQGLFFYLNQFLIEKHRWRLTQFYY